MSIDADYIAHAKEWQIRSLVSRYEFPVEGQFSDLLSVADLEARRPREINKKYRDHHIVGEMMTDNYSRIPMAITDMATRYQSDLELVGGEMDVDMSWLRIPSDNDKYLIVLIIRKFLEYQRFVHNENMTRPSKVEEDDYRVLKLIHNFLLEDAEDWINRVSPETLENYEEATIEDILNGGPQSTNFGEEPTRATLEELEVTAVSSFAALSGSASSW